MQTEYNAKFAKIRIANLKPIYFICIVEVQLILYKDNAKIRLSERRENLFFFLGADYPSGWVVWGVFRVSVYCVLNLVILRGCSVKYRHTYIKSLYFCSCNIY